jgi:hypothetical protein
MKIKIIAILSIFAFVFISSLQNIKAQNLPGIPTQIDSSKTEFDTINSYEINQLIWNSIVEPLADCGKIESWDRMDKTGHRSKAILGTNVNIHGVIGNKLIIKKGEEIQGTVTNIDGSFQSHLCSVKMNYSTKEIWVRNSVLDDWQTVKIWLKNACKK